MTTAGACAGVRRPLEPSATTVNSPSIGDAATSKARNASMRRSQRIRSVSRGSRSLYLPVLVSRLPTSE